MSHPEQLEFFRQLLSANADLVAGGCIVEIGSYDVNGSVRELAPCARTYVGVDLIDGPGVDLVSYGHQVDLPTGSVDVTISGECFEHDPYWRLTFANMVRMTRPGGLVLVSCASLGRPEHGTERSTPGESPGTESVGSDHYRNVRAAELRRLADGQSFSDWFVWYNSAALDLYFAGRRTGATPGSPQAQVVRPSSRARIRAVTPPWVVALRLPLVLGEVVLPGRVFHHVSYRYWRCVLALLRAGGKAKRRLASLVGMR